jgi:hypothetical protein
MATTMVAQKIINSRAMERIASDSKAEDVKDANSAIEDMALSRGDQRVGDKISDGV